MKHVTGALIALSLAILPATSFAQEADFLNSLNGSFSGSGTARFRTSSSPFNVKCTFTSTATSTFLALEGRCRAAVVVSRTISANLKVNGSRYSGIYVGDASGPAGLSGSRKGNAINLGVSWAKDVNGDRQAVLKVEKIGGNLVRLTITDKDPQTGNSVVTSQIDLRRS